MRIKKIYFNHFNLAIIATLLLSACSTQAPQETEASARVAKLLKVSKTNSGTFLNYPAIINSKQLSNLSFQTGGVVNELSVVEAQKVKKGDVLAKLDQRDAQAGLKSARAQFDNAQAEYQRAVNLMKEDAIAKTTLDQRKSQRDVSKAQLETAQKALQDTVLVAPYDGAISKVAIKKQQSVQAGNVAISILGSGGLQATINLPSSIMAKAQKTKPATDSYLVLDSASDQHIPIVFKEADLEADAASQTYAVTFSFDAPAGLNILPGMNAVVWFKDPSEIASSVDKIRIPLTAVATDGKQKYVWVVDKTSMKVSKRDIVIEANVGTDIGVISGLESGETIVSAGVSVLSEGMQVSLWKK